MKTIKLLLNFFALIKSIWLAIREIENDIEKQKALKDINASFESGNPDKLNDVFNKLLNK